MLAKIEPAIRSSASTVEAAAKLGVSDGSLRGVCRNHAIDFSAMLDRPIVGPLKLDEPTPVVKEPPPPIEWTGARPTSTGAGLERRLILADTHFPFASVLACAAVIALAKAIQPHVILHLGDAFNAGAVSKHPRPYGGRETHSSAQAQGVSFFDALARAAPGSRRKLLPGNHDDWLLEFEDENPQFAGMFAAKWMGLDRLGWEIVEREQQPLILGPVAYKHGTGGGEHFAKRYAERDAALYGVRCVVVGHHHTFQHYRARNGCEAWGCGWLGRSAPRTFDYAKKGGEPAHWQAGALVQDILGDHVTTTPVRLDHGAALFGGRLITSQQEAA